MALSTGVKFRGVKILGGSGGIQSDALGINLIPKFIDNSELISKVPGYIVEKDKNNSDSSFEKFRACLNKHYC